MSAIMHALRLVYGKKTNLLWAALTAAFAAGFLLWSGGAVTVFPEGIYFSPKPMQTVALAAVSILLGILAPMQAAAVRQARALAGGGGTLLGTLASVAGLSCCAPLLLPALLSFAGVSGTTLIFWNAAVSRYLVPLSVLAVSVLLFSLYAVSRSIAAACKLKVCPVIQPRPIKH
jgi:hypothetical protein